MSKTRRSTSGLAIAAVSRETGIPVTTLRFYEKELPLLFRLRKTRGGHRRYGPADVARFRTVRRLTESEGLKLADVRRVLGSPSEPDRERQELERLLRIQKDQGETLDEIVARVARLEARVRELSGGDRRRWFKRR